MHDRSQEMLNRTNAKRVVGQESWIDQNHDALHVMYNTIQCMNEQSGRRIFDREKCNFATWSALAYRWSTLYTAEQQWMYDEDIPQDEEEDEECHQG